MIEVFFKVMFVDYDVVVVWFNKNMSSWVFVMVSVVVLIFCYFWNFWLDV